MPKYFRIIYATWLQFTAKSILFCVCLLNWNSRQKSIMSFMKWNWNHCEIVYWKIKLRSFLCSLLHVCTVFDTLASSIHYYSNAHSTFLANLIKSCALFSSSQPQCLSNIIKIFLPRAVMTMRMRHKVTLFQSSLAHTSQTPFNICILWVYYHHNYYDDYY